MPEIKCSAKKLRSEERELEYAGELAGIRSDMEAKGLLWLGSVTSAAKSGYFTPLACEKMGQPVQPGEEAECCATMADCPTNLCRVDEDGNRVRPCLPVYFRPFGNLQ